MSGHKTIIISQPYGGLGDNLQYSTLPELYAKEGYKVYISNKNAYRNPEIYDLVWKSNPYVEGISDLEPNAGWAVSGYAQRMNHMTEIEVIHGLENGYRKCPVIYYTPKLIPDLSNSLLYDPTSISGGWSSDENIKPSFESMFIKHSDCDIRKIEFEKIQNKDTPYFNHPKYIIHSIFDYCDAIYSCKVFVCFQSGSAVLASAVKQDRPTPEIIEFIPKGLYDCDFKIWNYPNITYLPFV